MNQFGTVLVGSLIGLMLAVNAGLEQAVGQKLSLLAINGAGLAAILAALAAGRKKMQFRKGLHWIYYTAGASGIVLTLLNNATVGVLGVSIVMTLGCLGQLAASVVIDHFGLFGLKKRPFKAYKLAGFALITAGILVMAAGRSV